MKRLLIGTAMILALAVMVFAGAQEESTTGGVQPTTLKGMMFGGKPTYFDDVLEEFYNRTSDTLKVTLDIEWNATADHKQKLLLRMTAGEELDFTFDAPWMHLNNLAKDGAYYDLSEYFGNPQYPGLAICFSDDYLNSNRFYDKIYGVPLTHQFGSYEGIVLRKDLMNKYGFEEILTWNELASFFDTILENEPGVVPLAVEGRLGLFDAFLQTYERGQQNVFIAGDFFVALSDDYKTVLGATYAHNGRWGGDPAENIANFPEPWNTRSAWEEQILTFKEWNRYLEPDVMSQTDPGSLFTAGKAAGLFRGLGGSANVFPQLRRIVPDAEPYVFPYDDYMRSMTPRTVYTTYKVWNFLCLPVTGKQPDRVMEFLDWIFSDVENHDLFELGIEGIHWEAVGENAYTRLASADKNYIFPWYQLTGTPLMYKISADMSEQEKVYVNWASNPDRYILDPLTGFDFEVTPVKSEKAKVDAIYGEITLGISNGAFDDPIAILEKTNADARGAGLEEMRVELIRQLQTFLDEKH